MKSFSEVYINVWVCVSNVKITKSDLKQGIIRVVPENADDLWTLSQVIDAGDEISGKTTRKIKLEGDRKSEITKKIVFLKVSTERVEFDAPGELRISGKIVEGPEDVARGSYHTISVEAGQSITILKHKWLSYQLDRIKEAAAAKPPKVIVCAFDRDEAVIAKLTKKGYEVLARLKGEVAGKRMETKITKNFYEEIISNLREYSQRFAVDKIILASPAFWKDELMKVLKDEDIKKKTILATVASGDEQGVKEALKRPETQEALRQDRVSKEIKLVEQVLTGISKGSAVAYGLDDVALAAAAGAVSTLLITDALITKQRAENKFSDIQNVLDSVEKSKGAVVIVGSSHEGGKKLDGLGGIAALLRYRLS